MRGDVQGELAHLPDRRQPFRRMLSVKIILPNLEDLWRGSTNRNLQRQFFIGNAVIFRQQLLRKSRGTLEYLRPVRLDELEICIGLNVGFGRLI